jgi:hypothetical protein
MDKFVDALIASLVLKGVLSINIIAETREAELDRLGLYAMYACAEQALSIYGKESGAQLDKDWQHFLVRVRNIINPGQMASFTKLRSELVQKTITLVELDVPHEGAYRFLDQKGYMESLLSEMHPNIQFHAEMLATAYVAGREQKEQKTA